MKKNEKLSFPTVLTGIEGLDEITEMVFLKKGQHSSPVRILHI